LDFPQFDEQIGKAISDISSCEESLHQTMLAFDRAFLTSSGAAEARSLFGVRKDLPATDFFYMVADGAAMADQYGQKARLCAAIDKGTSSTDIERMSILAAFIKSYWGENFASGCFYDTDCVRNNKDIWHNDGGTSRCWRWQKCTEVAYLQSAPLGALASHRLRSVNLTISALLQQCQDMFAENGTTIDTAAGVKRMLERFGGASPQNMTNVFFSDFSDDPWQQASVRSQTAPSLPFKLVTFDGAGHCHDLGKPSDLEPAILKAERATFEQYLDKWLA
jgi:hypothetical protein